MAVVKALNALHPDWLRVEASNADEALEHISQGKVDIIVLDFNMPGKDGLVFAEELRQTHPQISVAVISANHQQGVVNRTRAAGATFLPKPLTAKELGDFLDIAVKRSQGAA
jgi:DNA-binding NarL/FixJ family response regulator